jgi:hypothetical protein
MHAEAVRYGETPSRRGLIQDEGYPVTSAECNAAYHLDYESEAQFSAAFCGVLADEIVTARPPYHMSNAVLDPVALDQELERNQKWHGQSCRP